MTARVSERDAMIAHMTPVLLDGRFAFVTTRDDAVAARLDAVCISRFREVEGMSFVVPVATASEMALAVEVEMACITLNVFSDLEGVGLTAAVSGALADAGIPANVIAAYHHDHVFVPAARAEAAMACLLSLQAKASQGRPHGPAIG